MGDEPVSSELGCEPKRAGFVEEMRGTRNDRDPALAAKPGSGVFVETQHDPVVAADYQQRRGADRSEVLTREVGAATSRDDREHGGACIGCGTKCGGRAGAGTEVPDGETAEVRLVVDKTCDLGEALSKQIDVEDIDPVARFFNAEQVEQQGGDSRLVQYRGDVVIARAVTTAPAAVGEHHHCPRILGDGQVATDSIESGR